MQYEPLIERIRANLVFQDTSFEVSLGDVVITESRNC